MEKKKNGLGLNLIDFVVILLIVICLIGVVIRVRQIDWFNKNSALEEHEIYFSVTDISYISEDALVVGDTFKIGRAHV